MLPTRNALYKAVAILCFYVFLIPFNTCAQFQFDQVTPLPPAPENIANFTSVAAGSVAFADVEEDGDQDVLITGIHNGYYGSSYIAELYSNDGAGNYTLITGTPFTGVWQGSVAFADIDGDGDQDLLITGNSGVGIISELYSNDGAGNYSLVTGTPFTGVLQSSIAFSDVDGDDDQDLLITGNSTSGFISELYSNDGIGNYTLVTGTPFAPVSAGSIAFSDVEGDGDQDVLITGNSGAGIISELYSNDGAGNFSLVLGTPFIGVYQSSIAFSDVNGDGDQDVLISGSNGSSNISKLYSNDGAGNYTVVAGPPFTGVYQGCVAFSDVEGDGDQDILITGSTGWSFISELYSNDGDGNYTLVPSTPFIGVYDSNIAFSDVDSDGDQDVLITGNSPNSLSKLYSNDGSGIYSLVTGTPFLGVAQNSVAFSDVEGDGDQDILITGLNGFVSVTELYANDGTGNFSVVEDAPFTGVYQSSIAFADVEGDGDQDVLITGLTTAVVGNGISQLYSNDGAGNYSLVTGTPFLGVHQSSVAFADVDGDGDQDLLITGNSSAGYISQLYSNDGAGNYSLVTGTPFSGVFHGSIAFSDVNNDGDQDVLITGNTGSGTISELYSNDGEGNYTLVTGTPFVGVFLSAIAFADVEGDGDQDVLITGDGISNLYLNDGAGNYTLDSGAPFTGVFRSSLSFADMEGDGDQDVLIAGNTGSGFISELYSNDGAGNYTLATGTSFTGVYDCSVALLDVEGDGDQDVLIVGNNDSNNICELYRNTTPASCQIIPICQAFTLALDATGNASLMASDIDDGSSVECGTPLLSLSQSEFTCADVGEHDIELTVSDENGDSETCVASVTITPSAYCYDCEDVLNGGALPGTPCVQGDNSGLYDSACNCVIETLGNINVHISDFTNCGLREISIAIFNQDDPELSELYISITDANGDYATPLFSIGTYSVYITVEGYLTQLYEDIIVEIGSNDMEVSGIIPGDMNGSNGVNISDVSILISAFGSTQEEVSYNPIADFNCDGAVNIIDVSILSFSFGMVGDSPPGD